MRRVADKYNVDQYSRYNHMVRGCKWNASAGKWEVTVENLKTGETFVDTCDVVVNGNGLLNTPKYTWVDRRISLSFPSALTNSFPLITCSFSYVKDADKYKGKVLHTARWDVGQYSFPRPATLHRLTLPSAIPQIIRSKESAWRLSGPELPPSS